MRRRRCADRRPGCFPGRRLRFAFEGTGTDTTPYSAEGLRNAAGRCVRLLSFGGVIFRTTCPLGFASRGRSLRSFPSRGESSGRAAACATALFVGPATPGSSLRSARRRSDSAVAGLRTWGLRPARLKAAANFPCNIIRRLRFAASPAQQSPAKKRSQPAEQNITKGVTHCLAPVLADCDRNHACGNGPLRHRCSARTSFGLVMRIVGKIRENSSANAKRLLRHCVPHAITGRCAGRNRSESGLCPLDPTYRRLDGGASAASSGRSSGMGIEARAAIGRG